MTPFRDRSSSLVQRMIRGDGACFDDVVAMYSEDVLRLCELLLGDSEEAKDVLQEAMLRLVRTVREKKFRTANGSIKGFLTTTARNLCVNRLSKKVDFRPIDEDDVYRHASLHNSRTPDRIADESRFESAFEDALTQLTDSQRTILVLHEVNGESQSEIAKSLNLSVECVRSHLYLARRKMRALLAPFAGGS
ncbi:MAG: sigma-70 family RNA polymerase sigma factor [bacterium]